jgi:hypothetical protein
LSTPSLSPKQEAFTLAYLETDNATEAYRRAYNADGMNPASVNREASALLDNPKITTWLGAFDAAQFTRFGGGRQRDCFHCRPCGRREPGTPMERSGRRMHSRLRVLVGVDVVTWPMIALADDRSDCLTDKDDADLGPKAAEMLALAVLRLHAMAVPQPMPADFELIRLISRMGGSCATSSMAHASLAGGAADSTRSRSRPRRSSARPAR